MDTRDALGQIPYESDLGAGIAGAWEGRAVGLLDLDAFFASVEQLDHPEWRGKPLIVGGDADKRGVVSTASYEARAFGVHSAMPSAQARRLCPQAIWTRGRYDRYRQMSDAVMACVLDETPRVEQVSIDEAFFDVTPGRFSREDPVAICQRISSNVARLGVTCSIGISTSKTVSKIASERNKPNGITVVYPGTEAAFLAPLSVRSMSGIGPRTCSVLESMGIKTLGQLARADVAQITERVGSIAPQMVERASGIDPSPVALADDPEQVKSVSNERTFATDITSRDDVAAALGYISSLCARRLRKKRLAGRTVTVKVCYRFGETRTARTTLDERIDDGRQIAHAAMGLLEKLWAEGTPIRLLGVAVSNWDDAPVQPRLFDDVEKAGSAREARSRLDRTTDELRARFGDSAAMLGSELRFRERVSNTTPQHKEDQ